MKILIYKTSIINSRDVKLVADELTRLVGKSNWHVDIGDCDKVLRLETESDVTEKLTHLLSKNGFNLEMLQ